MPECDYCGARFDDEEAHLRHLGEEHAGDLGRIERRRVERVRDDEDSGIPVGPAVLVGVLLFSLVVVFYVIFFFGGGAPAELGEVGTAHEHGTVQMSVLGEEVDFSQGRYQNVADRFHFEDNDGRVWHKHATGVTLAWGMSTLDIDLTETSVTYDGTTYRDGDPNYDVSITVNGDPVDPTSYVLMGVPQGQNPVDGDRVRIVVSRTNASG
jgi:hypothetical protein